MNAAEILKRVAEGYTEGTLEFRSGHTSGLNHYTSKNPVLWHVSNENLTRVTRIKQGLIRFEGSFLIGFITPVRGGANVSSPQASIEDIEEACNKAERVASQLAYVLQYDTPEVGYTNFQWATRKVQITSSGLVSGVVVQAAFNIRSPECLTDFVPPAPAPPAPGNLNAPIFETQSGVYQGFVEVFMKPRNDGAIEYATTDGSVPTPQNGVVISDTIGLELTQSALVRVRAFKEGSNSSPVAQAQFVILGLSVQAIPDAGTYLLGQLEPISLESALGAVIRFTINGNDPDGDSPIFTEAIPPFTENSEIKAFASNPPAADSPVFTFEYLMKLNAPELDTSSGVYITERLVSAVPAPFGVNEYRINGGASVVGDSVLVQESSFVEFRATSPNNVPSDWVGVQVDIRCAMPTIVPNGGNADDTTLITLATTTPGAQIRYTTNGTTPTESSTLYTDPFTLSASATITARAFKAGAIQSDVTSATFVITDADTAAFVFATGITDGNLILELDNYVKGLKTAGIWAKLRCIYPFVGGTEFTHKFNLKDPQDLDTSFRLQFFGGWVHNAQGAQPNGTDGYARTFRDSSFFDTSDGVSSGFQLGSSRIFDGGLRYMGYVLNRNTNLGWDAANNAMRAGFNGSLRNTTLFNGASNTGFWGMSLARSLAINSAPVVTNSGATTNANLNVASLSLVSEFFIGARNQATIDGYSSQIFCFAFIGNHLTATELQTLRTLTTTFNTAIR